MKRPSYFLNLKYYHRPLQGLDDIKRKQGIPEIVARLTQAEKDVRKLQSATLELDPLAELTAIADFYDLGGLNDVKRKGIMSEIIRRLTKVEEDIRKLKTRI